MENVVCRPKIALAPFTEIIAAKLLIKGMSDSLLKRDNKTLVEIIECLDYVIKASGITKEDMIEVSKLTLTSIFSKSKQK